VSEIALLPDFQRCIGDNPKSASAKPQLFNNLLLLFSEHRIFITLLSAKIKTVFEAIEDLFNHIFTKIRGGEVIDHCRRFRFKMIYFFEQLNAHVNDTLRAYFTECLHYRTKITGVSLFGGDVGELFQFCALIPFGKLVERFSVNYMVDCKRCKNVAHGQSSPWNQSIQ